MRARVLVVCPTAWDERQLAALPEAVRARHELLFDAPRDEDVRWDLDLGAFVEERVRRWRGRLEGVFSSSDYPGATLAAALATELGLPGSRPEHVLRAGHKFHAREVQRATVPEAVPRYRLFDPGDERTWPPASEFPCFVKPVKGSFSVWARRLEDREALRVFASSPALAEYRDYQMGLFEQLAGRYARFEGGARGFLAEELLEGTQVTLEGWIQGGRAHVLGVVDTTFHAGTRSFARFDYPSALAPAVQERMGRVACATAEALGLEHTLFNVELFHDASRDRIGLIEINPRVCGQFGDLYQKVDGVSGYEIALDLACGRTPRTGTGRGAFAAAASVPLRLFESATVRRAPDAARLRAIEREFPGTLLWSDCHGGESFHVGPEVEDGGSVRYAVVNLGAGSRDDIEVRLAAIRKALGFEFAPLPAAVPAGSPQGAFAMLPSPANPGRDRAGPLAPDVPCKQEEDPWE